MDANQPGPSRISLSDPRAPSIIERWLQEVESEEEEQDTLEENRPLQPEVTNTLQNEEFSDSDDDDYIPSNHDTESECSYDSDDTSSTVPEEDQSEPNSKRRRTSSSKYYYGKNGKKEEILCPMSLQKENKDFDPVL